MSRTIATNGTVGIRLTNASDNPVTVTADGTVTAVGYAIYGNAAVAWALTNSGLLAAEQYGVTFAGTGTISNLGTIAATGTKSTSVVLQLGGRVVNGGTSVPAAYITGSYYAVKIAGAAGAVVNFGTIVCLDEPGSGAVALIQGGTVTNGSTAANGALIRGGGASAVYIAGGSSALVANQGTIAGLGTGAAGVEVRSGGTVINGAPGNTGATITAPNEGVYAKDGAGTVINDGVIAGGPNASWGVYMRSGGSVLNGVAAAQILGAFRSVDIRGGYGTVLNKGTIAGLPGNSWGVYLAAGGTITNATTASAINGGGYAIVVQDGPGTVVNQGTIRGSTEGVSSSGIRLNAGGSVSNGAPGNNSATIGAALNAIMINGAAGIVLNDGTIAGAPGVSWGVYLSAGGSVTNGVAAAAVTGGQYGVEIKGGAGTVVNAGTIASAADTGVGLFAGGVVSNAAGGLITGYSIGVNFSFSDTATLTNAGLVSGYIGVALPAAGGVLANAGTILGAGGTAVLGGAGDDLVIIRPGAVFAGDVTGGGGANTLELASAASAGTLAGLGARYAGFTHTTVDPGAFWTLTGANAIDAGQTLTNSGSLKLLGTTLTIDGSLANDGTITVDPSTLVTSGIGGAGRIEIGTNSTVTLGGAVSAGETIAFTGTGGVLNILHSGSFAGTITGQGPTDTVNIACFAEGTRILTVRGEVPVQHLRAGDRLAAVSGRRLAPIVWLGHRHLDCLRHPRPDAVRPVCVKAGAIAAGVPHRDLWLSPDHSVLLRTAAAPVLVPIRHLLNGTTIVQAPRASVTYWHIELASHDAIVAEGLAAETYLDTGNRSAFAVHFDYATIMA